MYADRDPYIHTYSHKGAMLQCVHLLFKNYIYVIHTYIHTYIHMRDLHCPLCIAHNYLPSWPDRLLPHRAPITYIQYVIVFLCTIASPHHPDLPTLPDPPAIPLFLFASFFALPDLTWPIFLCCCCCVRVAGRPFTMRPQKATRTSAVFYWIAGPKSLQWAK